MRFITMLIFAVTLVAVGPDARAQETAKGWLGVEVGDVTLEEAAKLGWEAPRGVTVAKPVTGSPAAAAGLEPGDVLLSVDKQEIDGKANFAATIDGKVPGAVLKLRLLRGGKEKTVSVTLAVEQPKVAVGPLPMLNTGGHMALINDIAFTPDGTQLVSASDDKTIRVWDVATGNTVRTIRGEVAPGLGGKIYAMALSRDGKSLAVGGFFEGPGDKRDAIRLYDFASGRLVALLKGHENVVYGLAFSPDSQRLISGSADKTAIIWDVVAARAMHRLSGHNNNIYAVGFTPDGKRVVTGSDDHDLQLWRVGDGGKIATMRGHGDKVGSLAVAPDGTVASGDRSGEIRLWDGKTGAFLRVLARQKTVVGSLSFSPDGTKLLASCGYGGCTVTPQYVYDVASSSEVVAYRGHDSIVLATAISPDGRWVATAGGDKHEIHLWELLDGKRRLRPDGQPLTLGGKGQPVWAVGFSADGRRIGWGNTFAYKSHNHRSPFQYAMALPSVDAPLTGPIARPDLTPPYPVPLPGGEGGTTTPGEGVQSHNGAFLRAVAEQGGWSLSHRQGGSYGYNDAILDVKQDGRLVATIERGPTDGYGHSAYSLTPDGETIISGGANGVLTAYDRSGKMIGRFTGHEGDIWAVAPSPDGRTLLSGSADQTVRLWNLNTRELLVTLFRGTDGEWVMWTPQGYYAASGPGADLIGWQINHGPESAAEYVTAAQLRKTLNRTDIVARAIQLTSDEAAVKEAHGTSFKLSDLLAKPVPRFRITAPTANATLTGAATQIELALEATPDPVKLIRIQVNGTQIAAHQPESGPGFKPGTLKFPVPLAKGRNIIRVVAVNDTGETPAEVAITHNGDGDLDKHGTLYILAIGVDKYPNIPGKDLKVAVADAEAFAETMAARLGPSHERVVSTVLVNGGKHGEPVADNIRDALGELREAKAADTILIFVSGHGMNDEGANYLFLPSNTTFNGEAPRASTVVPWVDFQLAIEAAKGRRILFLDTCHSGNSYSQRLTNEAYQANIIVYSAARWDQLSWEDHRLGHGLFTYALVEGVNGAAKDKAGEVRTEGLRDYLHMRVPALAKNLKGEPQQNPQYFRARDAENFLLAHPQ